MKIVSLIENLTYGKDFIAEHGLSFYIEVEGLKLLFDTGQTGNFVHNANLLKIDLAKVDYLVLSHGHYDHTGGINAFLEINKTAKIVLKNEIFQQKFSGEREIGIPKEITIPIERTLYANEVIKLNDQLFLVPKIEIYLLEDTHYHGFYAVNDKVKIQDRFEDELFLTIIENNKLHIVSSCSHNGIRNIVQTAIDEFQFPIGSVIGGFHTKNDSDESIDELIGFFNKKQIENLGICHCTGVEKFAQFKQKSKGNTFYFHTGKEFTI